jgi:hypothetical protein
MLSGLKLCRMKPSDFKLDEHLNEARAHCDINNGTIKVAPAGVAGIPKKTT